MKHHILTRGFFTALFLLACPLAGAESQYPGANFEPVILYQDAEYIAKHQQTAAPVTATISPPPAVPAKAASSSATVTRTLGQPEGLVFQDYLVGGVILALAALIFWSIRQPGQQTGASVLGTLALAPASHGEGAEIAQIDEGAAASEAAEGSSATPPT